MNHWQVGLIKISMVRLGSLEQQVLRKSERLLSNTICVCLTKAAVLIHNLKVQSTNCKRDRSIKSSTSCCNHYSGIFTINSRLLHGKGTHKCQQKSKIHFWLVLNFFSTMEVPLSSYFTSCHC